MEFGFWSTMRGAVHIADPNQRDTDRPLSNTFGGRVAQSSPSVRFISPKKRKPRYFGDLFIPKVFLVRVQPLEEQRF